VTSAGSEPFEEATAALDSMLAAAATPRALAFWTQLLKGEATFRGVPMAGIRAATRQVWTGHGLADRSTDDLLVLAHRWFALPHSEDKLAAVLMLAELMPDQLSLRHVDALAAPFQSGDIADWNVTDWYCTKTLHRFLRGAPDLPQRAAAIAAWSTAPDLWQRRAGAVAFVGLAPTADVQFDGFVDLVLDACAANLAHPERFAHTGPGWVLRELSRAAPDRVQAFVAAHPEMLPEARRMATARLRPGPYRRR
jgi:3-methyladenine DNA glycosylase AlkD